MGHFGGYIVALGVIVANILLQTDLSLIAKAFDLGVAAAVAILMLMWKRADDARHIEQLNLLWKEASESRANMQRALEANTKAMTELQGAVQQLAKVEDLERAILAKMQREKS